MKNKMCTL